MMMECNMKTTLFLSTLAVSLIGATPLSAQFSTSTYSPAFGYPSYDGAAKHEPVFGSSDYNQGLVGTGQLQPQRERE
jgi:hypothetical protein